MKNIGVLGCGNMAQAIVKRVHQVHSDVHFHTYTPTQVKAKSLAQEIQGTFCAQKEDFPTHIDGWIIACKPQQFFDLVQNFQDTLKDKLVISIMAAITTDQISNLLDTDMVVRFMPGTPSEIGEGAKIWHFSHVQSGSRIGKRCVLGQNVNVGNNVSIGNYVKIQNIT